MQITHASLVTMVIIARRERLWPIRSYGTIQQVMRRTIALWFNAFLWYLRRQVRCSLVTYVLFIYYSQMRVFHNLCTYIINKRKNSHSFEPLFSYLNCSSLCALFLICGKSGWISVSHYVVSCNYISRAMQYTSSYVQLMLLYIHRIYTNRYKPK